MSVGIKTGAFFFARRERSSGFFYLQKNFLKFFQKSGTIFDFRLVLYMRAKETLILLFDNCPQFFQGELIMKGVMPMRVSD